jgi:hypothetical protein
MSFDSEKIIPLFDEFGYKDGSSIGNDISGKAESFEDMVEKDFRPSFG